MSIERSLFLFSVTARGNGRILIEELKKNHIRCHFQLSGKGTASSDMMDILGLDSSDKDIVLSIGSKTAVARLARQLSENLRSFSRVSGILTVITPAAVSNLVAVMADRQTAELEEKGKIAMTKSEYDYSLVLIAVNRGYTDSVIETARKAGATGGTVVRARLAEAELSERLYGTPLSSEREVIAILTPGSSRNAIMDAVNAEFGLRSKAQGILCSVPVDRAYKL